MYYKVLVMTWVMTAILCNMVHAQKKPFVEGVIIYNVTLVSEGNATITGKYVFTIKGTQLKKELTLSNGYNDIVLINFSNHTGFALKDHGGQRFAIQMNMEDIMGQWHQYTGFTMKEDQCSDRKIAGYMACDTRVTYKDGDYADLEYTSDLYPAQVNTFERFPGSDFLPLSFVYIDKSGVSMKFVAEKIEQVPVENAVFRKPPDYKVVTYNEYKKLNR